MSHQVSIVSQSMNHTYSSKCSRDQDVSRGAITLDDSLIAPPVPMLPDIVSNKVSHKMVDIQNNEHQLSNYTLREGFEGILIRVFYANGIIYTSSLRKLDISNSTFGKSRTFDQLLKDARPEGFQDLFNEYKRFSAWCYTYLLIHPELSLHQEINEPKLILVAITKCKLNVPEAQIDWSMRCKDKIPNPLKTRQANAILRDGGFVIASNTKDDSNLVFMRILSPQYHRRIQVTDENPNLLNRLYRISPMNSQTRDYVKRLTEREIDDLHNAHPELVMYPSNVYEPHDLALLAPAVALFNAVRDSLKPDVVRHYKRMIAKRAEFLDYLYKCAFDQENVHVAHRVTTEAMDLLDRAAKMSEDKDIDILHCINQVIRSIPGMILYSLIRDSIDL
uniref:Uncharacterized protein n=1 Tax=viral metagenome TaxID=1070528 RepID=A0A6C0BKN1_9ZZZZ